MSTIVPCGITITGWGIDPSRGLGQMFFTDRPKVFAVHGLGMRVARSPRFRLGQSLL